MSSSLPNHLDFIAAAPSGIQKLRGLILELAVRGKLVPQDPTDEPASELLKQIFAEKARLVTEGIIKRNTPPVAVSKYEVPFDLPACWAWGRLGDLLRKIGAGSTPLGGKQGYVPNGIMFLRSQNVWDDGLHLNNVAHIPTVVHHKMSGTHVEPGDLLFNITGASIGRCAVVPDNFGTGNVSQHVTIVRPVLKDIRHFLHILLISRHVQQTVMDVQVGVSREGLSIGKLAQFVIPLPPLAEQHRIVAKVDELMALCDRLEAEQTDAARAHAKLVETLLGTLMQSRDADELAANWQRLSQHFDTLFSTETSLDALKQTILQLAVMGKLVPQDPNDEPASELLKRIAKEKARLVAEGKIRKDKALTATSEDETSFELPLSWAWCRLGNVVTESGAGWSPSCEGVPRVENNWGVLKVSAVSWGEFDPSANKALPTHLEARPEHEVLEGDFLVSRANTAELIARSVVVLNCPSHLMLSDKIVRLKLSALCDRRYINLANTSVAARNYYARVAGGTSSSMKNVTREQILSLNISLPPLAEQHRIVAKVDEMMALCDRLKADLAESRTRQARLSATLIDATLQSA